MTRNEVFKRSLLVAQFFKVQVCNVLFPTLRAYANYVPGTVVATALAKQSLQQNVF
jgi:hypothetical protein